MQLFLLGRSSLKGHAEKVKDGLQMKNCIVRSIFQEDSSFTSNGTLSSPANWLKIVIFPFHIHPFHYSLFLLFKCLAIVNQTLFVGAQQKHINDLLLMETSYLERSASSFVSCSCTLLFQTQNTNGLLLNFKMSYF